MDPNDPDQFDGARCRPLNLHLSGEEGSQPAQRPAEPRRPRGLWRALAYLLGGPVAAFGAKNVLESARTIEGLAETIKAGPGPDRRVRLDENGTFDVRAMAFLAGTSAYGLETMLAKRRRQTARATKVYLFGGVCFLAFWLYEALTAPIFASLPYVLGLIAFCAVFFLSAFHNALINWQIRTSRLGSAREFLNAGETWWPS